MRKGFINSTAVMVFTFSLVLAFFAFVLFENDMHNASTTGLVVEKVRWYGDAMNYSCQKTGTKTSMDVAEGLFKTKLGGVYDKDGPQATGEEKFNNEVFEIEVTYSKNYPPKPKFIHPIEGTITGFIPFQWSYCDPDGGTPTFTLEYNTSTGFKLIPEEYYYLGTYPTSNTHNLNVSMLGGGDYKFRVNATDSEGRIGYDIKAWTVS